MTDETPEVPQAQPGAVGYMGPDRRAADRRSVVSGVPGEWGHNLRRNIGYVVVILALLVVTAGLVVSRNTDSGKAGAAAGDFVAPSCTGLSAEECQDVRLQALEDWANPPTATPTPTTSSPPVTTPPPSSPPPSTPPPTTPPPTTPPPVAGANIGMNAPDSLWNQRLSEVQATGGKIHSRRIFFGSMTDTGPRSIVAQACAAGMYPVLSFKPGHPWRQVAAGQWDNELNSLKAWLATVPCDVFVSLNHEPGKVGHNPPKTDDSSDPTSTPADFANMNIHALPILKSATGVQIGVILNGWMFIGTSVTSGPSGNGYSDAELAQWMPYELVQLVDVAAADHYQITSTGAHPLIQEQRHFAWAHRVGVRGVGVGEFNDFTAQGITDLIRACKAELLCRWIEHWNNVASAAGILSGARLTAFQNELPTS